MELNDFLLANAAINDLLRQKRIIRFYPGEGFRLNPELKQDYAEVGGKFNAGSEDPQVQDKTNLLLTLTLLVDEWNRIYAHAQHTQDYQPLKRALLTSCGLCEESDLRDFLDSIRSRQSTVAKTTESTNPAHLSGDTDAWQDDF
ncbi:MAG: hypothetical protein ACFB10_03295 [Salibacteraceae bacterium]